MSTKVIISNLTRLKSKYKSGFSKIRSAIDALVKSDKARGIQTRLVFVDDVNEMKKMSGKAVTNASDPRQNKAAVDAIYSTLIPDYLVILGATDVIPHQDLSNPIFGRMDMDKICWGDIPYACEAPYSQEPQKFIGPTRVLGRIPDITKGDGTHYLTGMLATASKWRSRSAGDYSSYLGISADIFKGSTALSLRNTFGSDADLQVSPPDGPQWNASFLSRRSHFVNCHGTPSDPHFYGQRGGQYPVAHDATWLNGRLTEGTVAAAVCCYGAELYDPAPVNNQQIGICSTYLGNGAYGFFGSTTIAYGGYDVNATGDLISQYFLKRVLSGASQGRAALEARQKFAQSKAELDPADLKTLAQYILLGDPSIQPVNRLPEHETLESTGRMRAAKSGARFSEYEVASRRRQLLANGMSITRTQAAVSERRSADAPVAIARVLRQLAKQNGMSSPELMSFDIERPSLRMKKTFAALVANMRAPTAFHVAIEKLNEEHSNVLRIVMLIAKEEQGQIVSVRKLFSR
jgi:hypothetical protein